MQKEVKIYSPQLGISPHSNLGGEIHDREILKALAELGVKIEILLPKNKPYKKDIKNWHVQHLPIKHIFPPYIFNLLIIPYLFKTYKKVHFNILRVHNPYFVGLGAMIFKLFHRQMPVVASYLHLEERSPFFTLIDKLIIKKFDLIIALSAATKKDIIRRYGVDSAKIAVVYPAVAKKFVPKHKNQNLIKKYQLKDKIILLYAGVLMPRKNPFFLLKVFTQLDNDRVVLVFCGDGPLRWFLVAMAKKLGVNDRVVFTGRVFGENLIDFYNLADIFVFPTKKEGFGLVVAEAMACEKPVVVSNNSSLPEIVTNGQDGFLVETNNIEKWVEVLEILIKDKDLRQQMGRAGRKKILKKFSWEKSAQETLKIFKKLLIW